jgi:hypothetical protein
LDSTAADRQKRFRDRQKRHKAGDHSLCATSKKCDASTATVTPDPVTPVTRDEEPFGPRGARLWSEMNGDKLAGGQRVLLEEACRTADRLDRFNALEAGDLEALLRFRLSDDGAEVTVTVDGVVSEARQQALALKQILAELRATTSPVGRKRGTTAAGGTGVPAGVGDLTARIRNRRSQAQG